MPRYLGEAAVIRNIIKQVSGKEVDSINVQKFLDLFGEDLDAAIVQAHRDFIRKHFGDRKSNQ